MPRLEAETAPLTRMQSQPCVRGSTCFFLEASWSAASKSDETFLVSVLFGLSELPEGIGSGDAELGHPCCLSDSFIASNGSTLRLSVDADDPSCAGVMEGSKVTAAVRADEKKKARRVVASSCVLLSPVDVLGSKGEVHAVTLRSNRAQIIKQINGYLLVDGNCIVKRMVYLVSNAKIIQFWMDLKE